MTTSDAMKRLLAVEAQNRLDKQGPYLERLATNSGISVQEILAEAARIEAATSNLSYQDRMQWIATDAGMTVSELRAEADALLDVDDGDGIGY